MTADFKPLALAARALYNAFYRLQEVWDDVEAVATEEELYPLNRAIADGNFPFAESLEETTAKVSEWAVAVQNFAENPPGLLGSVAAQISADVEEVGVRLVEEVPDRPCDTGYRDWQRGGLGGELGDFGAAMNLSVAGNLAVLLKAVEAGDIDAAREHANGAARAYMDGRREARDLGRIKK